MNAVFGECGADVILSGEGVASAGGDACAELLEGDEEVCGLGLEVETCGDDHILEGLGVPVLVVEELKGGHVLPRPIDFVLSVLCEINICDFVICHEVIASLSVMCCEMRIV